MHRKLLFCKKKKFWKFSRGKKEEEGQQEKHALNSKEMKSCVTESNSAGANKDELTLFLNLAGLVKVREDRLFWRGKATTVRVELAIELEVVISLTKVRGSLRILKRASLNPLIIGLLLASVLFIGFLKSLIGKIVTLGFSESIGSVGVVLADSFGDQVAAGEGSSVKNSAKSHDSDAGHMKEKFFLWGVVQLTKE